MRTSARPVQLASPALPWAVLRPGRGLITGAGGVGEEVDPSHVTPLSSSTPALPMATFELQNALVSTKHPTEVRRELSESACARQAASFKPKRLLPRSPGEPHLPGHLHASHACAHYLPSGRGIPQTDVAPRCAGGTEYFVLDLLYLYRACEHL